MPRIPDDLLASVVYLDKDMGKEGRATGFITSVDENGRSYQYVVTNSHVINRPEINVRFIATGNVVPLPMHLWESCKESDLAVCLLDGNMQDMSRLKPIPRFSYASHSEHLKMRDLGIGDDVFMVGRFLPAENRGVNNPTLRFGNISLWPATEIRLKGDDKPVSSFLAEMRSINGHSGSPVFLSIEPGSMNAISPRASNIGLLGVDRGHLTDEKNGDTPMAAIIPANKLVELLDCPKLREQRNNLK